MPEDVEILIKGEMDVTETYQYIKPQQVWSDGHMVDVWTYEKTHVEVLSAEAQLYYQGKLLLDFEDTEKSAYETFGTTQDGPTVGPPEGPNDGPTVGP